MSNRENKGGFELVRIGPDTLEDRKKYERDKVAFNKRFFKIQAEARAAAKRKACAVCGKECSSFCNSHSIPKFVLRHIENNGYVSSPLKAEIPSLKGPDIGLEQTGTFHIICNDCDNTIFKDYENEEAYNMSPSDKVLSQIALKNYLQMVYKREEERELYRILGNQFPNSKDFTDEKKRICDADLKEYVAELSYCKKAINSKTNNHFYLCYFKVLDYVVPVAAQASISLVSDFEDNVINNIYEFGANYELKNVHIAVLPLQFTSVVIMFIKDGEKRYRKFYKQFARLSEDDKLAAINYILFSYSENVFLESNTYEKVKENADFVDVYRKTTDFTSPFLFFRGSPLEKAISELSLSRRHEIPNLLDKNYSISREVTK